ncbi:MAG: motility associated factor glycosyltransferase family protein [Deltaproteobacteria bacterium]|nr:motility associated factor glycosyltransferase family protein [Deltaproteobacteria bacterium]
MNVLNENLQALGRNLVPAQGAPRFLDVDCDASNNLIFKSLANQATFVSQPVRLDLGNQAKTLLVFGFGDGRLLEEALKQAAVKEILVYEPDEAVLKKLFALRSFVTLLSHPKLKVFLGTDSGQLLDAINEFISEDLSRLGRLKEMLCFTNPIHQTLGIAHAEFNHFVSLVKKICSDREIETKPNVEDAWKGLANSLMNYPSYFEAPSFHLLKDRFKEKVGVVVSTGPSLSASLPYLKKLQDRVVIFACDSALSILVKNNIQPDFVGSLERLGQIAKLFEGVTVSSKTHLVAPSVLTPESFAAYQGPKMRVNRHGGGFEHWFYEVQETIEMGISASHVCMVGLKHLGCGPIYLLGQDGAYDPLSGDSHDQGAAKHILEFGKYEKQERDEVQKLSFLGYDGQEKLTNRVWREFHERSERILREQSFQQVYHVLPKEYGIPIEGTSWMDPKDLDQLNQEEPFSKDLGDLTTIAKKEFKEIESQARINLKQNRDALDDLIKSCLAFMREIGFFTMKHDPNIQALGNEEAYKKFFARVEAWQADLFQQNNGFFDRVFQSYILSSHAYFGLQFAQLQNSTLPFSKITKRKIELLYEWLNMVQIWAGRALDMLEYRNQEWKYW